MTTKINDIYNVTNYLIEQAQKQKITDLTHMKLQKLLFYSYSYYLVKNNPDDDNLNDKLFNSNIEAWHYGPVIPDIYNKFRIYKNQPVKPIKFPKNNCQTLTQQQKKAINYILKHEGNKDAWELVEQTHFEDPWFKCYHQANGYNYEESIMQDEEIYDYYLRYW